MQFSIQTEERGAHSHVARPCDHPTHRKTGPYRLEENELEATRQKLNGILGWIDQLAEVDVTGVPPMVGTETETLRQREDKVTDGNCRDALLACAPETSGPFYTVPKVVE